MPGTRQRTIAAVAVLAFGSVLVGCGSSPEPTVDAAALPYQQMLETWHTGYWFWRIAYTILTALAVTLPALVAAGIPNQANRRQVVAAAATSIIAVTSFMQAGEKATAHEHAYLCMRLTMAEYVSKQLPLSGLPARAKECAAHIDYDYLDPGASRAPPPAPATSSSQPAPNSTTAPPP